MIFFFLCVELHVVKKTYKFAYMTTLILHLFGVNEQICMDTKTKPVNENKRSSLVALF